MSKEELKNEMTSKAAEALNFGYPISRMVDNMVDTVWDRAIEQHDSATVEELIIRAKDLAKKNTGCNVTITIQYD